MVTKTGWQVLVLLLALTGFGSTAYAANEMGASFAAAEAGNFDSAVSIWKALAEKGDPQAQFNLGLMYHSGLGLAQSEGEAVKWYKKAAEGGYSAARVYLVVGYEEGWFGLSRDQQKADYWRDTIGQN
ncbi:MAG: tetratricopeptide repeat protein [Pseudomonadota bacterium]|nr:tetratricopeptide repeat protein [Pseudomonadota bacterium]